MKILSLILALFVLTGCTELQRYCLEFPCTGEELPRGKANVLQKHNRGGIDEPRTELPAF